MVDDEPMSDMELEWRKDMSKVPIAEAQKLGKKMVELCLDTDAITAKAALSYVLAAVLMNQGGPVFKELFKFYLGTGDFIRFTVDSEMGVGEVKH